jgi:hypothetical protein
MTLGITPSGLRLKSFTKGVRLDWTDTVRPGNSGVRVPPPRELGRGQLVYRRCHELAALEWDDKIWCESVTHQQRQRPSPSRMKALKT